METSLVLRRKGWMNTSLVVFLMVVGAVGCTSPCQYVRSTEEAEANLDIVRARKNALEQEVKSLRDLNEKLIVNADSLHTEVQDLKVRRKTEQDSDAVAKEPPVHNNLDQKIKDLTAETLDLQDQYAELKKQNQTLKAAAVQYKKELTELQRIPAFTDVDLKRYR